MSKSIQKKNLKTNKIMTNDFQQIEAPSQLQNNENSEKRPSTISTYAEKVAAVYLGREKIRKKYCIKSNSDNINQIESAQFVQKFKKGSTGTWKGTFKEKGWEKVLDDKREIIENPVEDDKPERAKKHVDRKHIYFLKKKEGKDKDAVIALYGNEKIVKGYCENCKVRAFIIDGMFSCCGEKTNIEPKKFRRETDARFKRDRPSKKGREAILKAQFNRCIYCNVEFGTYRFKKGKPVKILIHWDHFMPFAYGANNKTSNFVAACHVCNGIKSSHVFNSLDEAKVELAAKRQEKGYDF
jgi:hypothetical protein